MSKALVRARGMATPEQFKTDYSQFMKNNIAMNRLLYPGTAVLDKSDSKLTFLPSLPKTMVDKAQAGDKLYVAVYLKDDTNTIQADVKSADVSHFTENETIGGVAFAALDANLVFTISGANLTASSKYDVHFIFSDKEITPEVAESANDFPFVLYGNASEFIVEVTAQA